MIVTEDQGSHDHAENIGTFGPPLFKFPAQGVIDIYDWVFIDLT